MAGGGGEAMMRRAGGHARVRRSRSPAGSVEVTSSARSGAGGAAEDGHRCPWCVEYHRLVWGASSQAVPGAGSGVRGDDGSARSGHSNKPSSATERQPSMDSWKSSPATSRAASSKSNKDPSATTPAPSIDSMKTSSSTMPSKPTSARSGSSGSSSSHGQYSVSSVPDGTEDSSWGGVDEDSVFQCSCGKPPRRLFCWEGKNTGRHFLGCNVKDKAERCGFVQWLDGEWHPRAQKVMSTLWGMIGYYISVADKNQVDYMAECALKNEAVEENQSLLEEKEVWEREKQSLLIEREQLRKDKENVHMRWRFAQGLCQAMQVNVRNEVQEKKRIWLVVIALVGTLVAFIFGVVLKLK